MLFERALQGTFSKTIGPQYLKRLLALKNKTRHYIFDEDASRKQGRFAVEHADLVCKNAAIAIPPFPNTYIEIDQVAALRAHPKNVIYDDASKRLGFLFTEHGEVFTISGDERFAFISPFIYCQHGSLNTPSFRGREFNLDMDLQNPLSGDRWDIVRNALLLGGVADKIEDERLDWGRNLTRFYDIHLSRDDLPAKILENMFYESMGTLKRAIAAVLLLNERAGPLITKVPASRKLIGGKLRASPPHAIVTIDLDSPRIRKLYQTPVGHHQSPIHHEVAGHWVHYDVSSQCKHDWVPFHSDDAEKRDLDVHGFPLSRLVCSHCGGRRTKKLNFERGTGDLVRKTYKVIASKEQALEKPK